MNYTVTRGGIVTPCIGICTIDPTTKICKGCKRTREELTNWKRMSQTQRLEVIEQLKDRA